MACAVCSKCGETFERCRPPKVCEPCLAEYGRQWRAAKNDAGVRYWNNDAAKRFAKRRRKDPVEALKEQCRNKILQAVRKGRLVRQPCEVCALPNAQAHHDDYNKPTDIRWLCPAHHREWHKHNTPVAPVVPPELQGMARPVAPRVRKTHCAQGHQQTEANVYVSRLGARACRICLVRRTKGYRAQRRAEAAAQ